MATLAVDWLRTSLAPEEAAELYVEAAEHAPGRAPPLGAGLRRSIRTLGKS